MTDKGRTRCSDGSIVENGWSSDLDLVHDGAELSSHLCENKGGKKWVRGSKISKTGSELDNNTARVESFCTTLRTHGCFDRVHGHEEYAKERRGDTARHRLEADRYILRRFDRVQERQDTGIGGRVSKSGQRSLHECR